MFSLTTGGRSYQHGWNGNDTFLNNGKILGGSSKVLSGNSAKGWSSDKLLNSLSNKE